MVRRRRGGGSARGRFMGRSRGGARRERAAGDGAGKGAAKGARSETRFFTRTRWGVKTSPRRSMLSCSTSRLVKTCFPLAATSMIPALKVPMILLRVHRRLAPTLLSTLAMGIPSPSTMSMQKTSRTIRTASTASSNPNVGVRNLCCGRHPVLLVK